MHVILIVRGIERGIERVARSPPRFGGSRAGGIAPGAGREPAVRAGIAVIAWATMRARRSALLVVTSTLLFTLGAGIARADDEADRGQARALGTKAYEAAEHGDWAKAEDLFRRAEALYHAPTLLLGLARARAHLGKYVEAWEDYHRILVEPLPPNASAALKKAIDEAQSEITTVEGKRAYAVLDVKGATSPAVTLDGVAIAAAALGTERAVNPGPHTMHAEAPGFKPADTTFTVGEGGKTTASLTLVALSPSEMAAQSPSPSGPAPASSAAAPASDAKPAGGNTMRTLGIVGMGLGGVGLITGAVTGFMAMGKHSDLQSDPCANAGCGPTDAATYQSSVDSYKTMGTVSTISFIAGGVLGAGGAVLFFVSRSKEPSASSASTSPSAPAARGIWVSPYIGAASVGAVGTF
jgi:hypothetical protein